MKLAQMLRNHLTLAYASRDVATSLELSRGLCLKLRVSSAGSVHLLLYRANVAPSMLEWWTVLRAWPWPLPVVWPTPEPVIVRVKSGATLHGLRAAWPLTPAIGDDGGVSVAMSSGEMGRARASEPSGRGGGSQPPLAL